MAVALWILIDQIGELMTQGTAVVEGSKEIIEPLKTIISKLDTICGGGSGISSA